MKTLIPLVTLTLILGGCSAASDDDECNANPDCTCPAGATKAAVCGDNAELESCTCVDDAAQADHATVGACSPELACPAASAQHIEGGNPAAMHKVECLVAGMRDRNAGTYELTLDHTFGNGGDDATFTLAVSSSGRVTVAALKNSSGSQYSESGATSAYSSTRYAPTVVCDLKPATFFAGCLAELEKADGQLDYSMEAWDCVAPEVVGTPPWFENCVEQAPVCE